MLKQLDTLIGFAVVMAVVSLLITIVTQIVGTVLGLRGRYLADALETMIHKIDPTITDRCHKLEEQVSGKIEMGKELSKWILTHPILSDSLLPMAPNRWDNIPVIAWLRRRWRIASAIRPDELFQVLKDVAGASPGEALAKEEPARKFAELVNGILDKPDSWKAEWRGLIATQESVATDRVTEAREAKALAIETATRAEAETDATKKQAATKEASERVLAAKEAVKRSTQAAEIAKRAKDSATDMKEAKRFALEVAMRAAATKLLAALYVPNVTSGAAVVAPSHPVTSGDNVITQ